MKKINQKNIKEILNCELATVSRYLSGKREIKLSSALKVSKKLNVPVDIFTNADTQMKYFGKSFINTNIPNTKENTKV